MAIAYWPFNMEFDDVELVDARVTWAVADFVGSVTDVAVTITVPVALGAV